jgi:hypothetical protein
MYDSVVERKEIVFLLLFMEENVHICMFMIMCGRYLAKQSMVLELCLEWVESVVLSSPAPGRFLEQFQQVSFFYLYTCVHSICNIFILPHPFLTSSLSCWYPTPGRTCAALLFSSFVKENKNDIFVCLR